MLPSCKSSHTSGPHRGPVTHLHPQLPCLHLHLHLRLAMHMMQCSALTCSAPATQRLQRARKRLPRCQWACQGARSACTCASARSPWTCSRRLARGTGASQACNGTRGGQSLHAAAVCGRWLAHAYGIWPSHVTLVQPARAGAAVVQDVAMRFVRATVLQRMCPCDSLPARLSTGWRAGAARSCGPGRPSKRTPSACSPRCWTTPPPTP